MRGECWADHGWRFAWGRHGGQRQYHQRAPTGDTSCYGSVGFGTADFLVPQVPGQYANRIYLEWGSVDLYNTLQSIGTDGNPINFGNGLGDTITGAYALGLLGNPLGLLAPDAFLKFDFPVGDGVTAIRFGSSNTAFEFDNIFWSYADELTGNAVAAARLTVPEPPDMPVLALALAWRARN